MLPHQEFLTVKIGKKLIVKLDLNPYLDFYYIPLDTGRKLNNLEFF